MRFLPDPILRQKAKKVGKILPGIKSFTDNMIKEMHDYAGVGLAANQIGSLQKIVVIQLPGWEKPIIMINLEITDFSGSRKVEEGCLSIPGYRGFVDRPEYVQAKAVGLNGKKISFEANGLFAQALFHEADHLNGILYIDRLTLPDDLWQI